MALDRLEEFTHFVAYFSNSAGRKTGFGCQAKARYSIDWICSTCCGWECGFMMGEFIYGIQIYYNGFKNSALYIVRVDARGFIIGEC